MSRSAGRWPRPYHSSGNIAFDEYREQTLQRLEEEQREFKEFLRQLRMAKDRTEFDRFMAKRRERAAEGTDDLNDGNLDHEAPEESADNAPKGPTADDA